jgi:hypothetical protein
MYKYLFFDDKYLFEKENAVRKYGEPELIEDAVYLDENITTVWGFAWTFPIKNNCFRMLYYGRNIHTGKYGLYSAISEDGVHFLREDISEKLQPEKYDCCNQVIEYSGGSEPACIFEDVHAVPEERYKLLMTKINKGKMIIEGIVCVSSDLLHWKELKEHWSEDGEPCVGVFYNKVKECYTILKRPAWGVRLVGYSETKDWRGFTDFQMCLQPDSLDGDLDEIYGMPAFAYDGWYIGFPYIYGGHKSEMCTKYNSGTMKAQLSYSHDGRYWIRSLREAFIGGEKGDKTANSLFYAPCVYPSTMRVGNDGAIYIQACASALEHGPCFRELALNGRIFNYKLRKDGLIKLESADKAKESVISTRENIWQGRELHLNLKVQKATVAVYISEEHKDMGLNLLSGCCLLEGYSHEDCIPFSGDSCNWVPVFKSGKTINALDGKVLIFQLKFYNGEIYSIYGNMIPVFNIPAARYRTLNQLPESVL